MKRIKIQSDWRTLINYALMSSACLFFIAVNIKMNVNPANLILYAAGSLFYFLYIKFNDTGFRHKCDYIQSGEGISSILIILFFSNLMPGSIFMVTLLSYCCILLLEFIYFVLFKIKSGDSAMNGILVNIIAIILFYFLSLKGLLTGIHEPVSPVFGFYQGFRPDNPDLLMVSVPAAVILILIFRMKSDLRLFSHGNEYFTLSRFTYGWMNILITASRSLSLTLALLFSGLTGGAGAYYDTRAAGRFSDTGVFLFIMTYTQFIIMMMQFFDKNWVIPGSAFLTYVIYFFSNRSMVYLYGRN